MSSVHEAAGALPPAGQRRAGPATPAGPRRAGGGLLAPRAWMVLLPLVLALTATVAAMRRTSTTFDEIVFIAGGARGMHTGRFDLTPDHPPLMHYIYGLPAYLSHPNYPKEIGWGPDSRYAYARDFFWRSGNDPERLAFRSRLVAVLAAGLLTLLVWAFTLRTYGPAPALLAATLVAFLPDVLAHGGVAYSDVPMAAAYLAALWAIDSAVRRPGAWRGALAGGAAALALCVKYSGVLVPPAALLLVGAEAFTRPADRRWGARLALAVTVAFVAAYLSLVLIYRGDWRLAALLTGIQEQVLHVQAPGGAPNYLLGRTNPRGFWYFYPVAFLYKTPASLHFLMLAAIVGFTRGGARGALPRRGLSGLLLAGRRVLGSPLRVPLLGAVVYGLALLRSHNDIGFRYALPVLPLVCLLTAVGVVRCWRALHVPLLRPALLLLVAWYVVSPLRYYPWFLSYLSEYGPGPEQAHEILVDSNIDWGQGLLSVRDFMRRERIPVVYLSYFGSALPEGYGIRYVTLPSTFPLPTQPTPPQQPRWLLVSATNLHPVYFDAPGIRRMARYRPEYVLGGSIYAYRLR